MTQEKLNELNRLRIKIDDLKNHQALINKLQLNHSDFRLNIDDVYQERLNEEFYDLQSFKQTYENNLQNAIEVLENKFKEL